MDPPKKVETDDTSSLGRYGGRRFCEADTYYVEMRQLGSTFQIATRTKFDKVDRVIGQRISAGDTIWLTLKEARAVATTILNTLDTLERDA